MAVPLYGSPQAQNAPLDAARLNPGMATNPTGAIGQGLQNASAGFQQINHEADVLRITDAYTPFKTDVNQIELNARQIKGKQVVDPEAYNGDQGASLTETALADFDKAVQARSEGLTERQKVLFNAAAQRDRTALQAQVQAHETQQLGVMQNQIYQDRDSVLADTISKLGVKDGYPDGEVIKSNLADRVENARKWAASQGLDADMAEQAVKAGSYTSVINNLIAAKKPDAALGFFSEHKMELDEKTRLHLGGAIAEQVMANQVQTMAQEITASGKSLDEQQAMVDQKADGNAHLHKELSEEVNHRFMNHKRSQEAAQQDTYGKLWDMRFPTMPGQQSVGMPDIMRSQEWASLNGNQRNDLRAQWEHYAKRNQNDPAALVAQFATYQRFLDDPKTLLNLTDGQISSYMGALGPDLTMRLMESKRKVAGNLEALKANTLNDIPFKDIAAEYGLKVKGTMSQEDSAKLGLLRDKALEAIRQEQEATGKPMGPERKEELLRRQLVNVSVNQPGWWLGLADGTTDKPLFQVGGYMELKATDEEKTQALDILAQAEAPFSTSNVQTMVEAIRKKKAAK